MTPPEIQLLLHRLLWPVWQVRWEAARRLADLISSGDTDAARGLLDWIGGCRLESEVVIGLSVIDAFKLAVHFDGRAVAGAVKAPSHLSDALLRRTFGLSSTGRYGFAKGPANVNEHVAAYFHKKMGQAIPLSFQSTLERLESRSGLPFLDRWEYEWQWLQGHLREPLSSNPSWFTWDSHREIGYFDLRQREVYMSAYLRALAFATDANWVNDETAEYLAMEVIVLDPGLAAIAYRERPAWSQGLATSERTSQELGEFVWSSAQNELAGDRALLSARAVDISGRMFKEIEIDLVASPGPWTLPEGREEWPPLDRTWLGIRAPSGELRGPLASSPALPEPPYPLTLVATPMDYARWHLDLFPEHLQVARPELFADEVTVASCSDGVGLELRGVNVSATRIWNTAWAPTKPSGLASRIGRITDVRSMDLRSFLARRGLTARRLAYLRIGRRDSDYSEFKVEHAVTWLDPEGGMPLA